MLSFWGSTTLPEVCDFTWLSFFFINSAFLMPHLMSPLSCFTRALRSSENTFYPIAKSWWCNIAYKWSHLLCKYIVRALEGTANSISLLERKCLIQLAMQLKSAQLVHLKSQWIHGLKSGFGNQITWHGNQHCSRVCLSELPAHLSWRDWYRRAWGEQPLVL